MYDLKVKEELFKTLWMTLTETKKQKTYSASPKYVVEILCHEKDGAINKFATKIYYRREVDYKITKKLRGSG